MCYVWCQKVPLSKNKKGECEGRDVLDVRKIPQLAACFLLFVLLY